MIAALALALSLAAPASEPTVARWSARDTALEAVFLAGMVVDWRQTRAIARGAAFDGYTVEESNPILGAHPSASRVNAYFAAAAALHAGIAVALPGAWRSWWQVVGIGVEAHAIGRNVLNGITLQMMF